MAEEATILDGGNTQTEDTTDTTVSGNPGGEQVVLKHDATAETKTEVDWRADMAGGDDKLLGFLGRFHSKDAAVKAWKQQHDDIDACIVYGAERHRDDPVLAHYGFNHTLVPQNDHEPMHACLLVGSRGDRSIRQTFRRSECRVSLPSFLWQDETSRCPRPLDFWRALRK